jgi:hypothetical protein
MHGNYLILYLFAMCKNKIFYFQLFWELFDRLKQ